MIDQRGGDHQGIQEIQVYSAETADASGAGAHVGQPTQSPSNDCLVNTDALGQKGVQSEFVVKKDAMSRVKMSSDLKVAAIHTGIRAQYSHYASVIKKCGNYADTSLKIMSLLCDSDRPINQSDIADAIVNQTTQIRYLPKEYTGVVVDSKYGTDAGSTFRSLQRNSMVFPPSVIDRVETAVNLSNLVTQIARKTVSLLWTFTTLINSYHTRLSVTMASM